MSKIPITCPECQSVLKVSPEVLGKKAKCPKCNSVIRLVASIDATESIPSRATAPEPKASIAEPTTQAVPMAKLLPGAGTPMAQPLDQPQDTAAKPPSPMKLDELGSLVDARPKVKFKRKRNNPLPTIILGVIALSVLGIAIALIAISQNYKSTTADAAHSLPVIQFVSDISTSVGKRISIPIKVQYPPTMTMAQTQEWKITLSENSPASAAYDPQNEQILWEPTFHDAGENKTIEAIIEHSTTKQSNSTRFNVKIEAIPQGEKELLAWAESMDAKGTKVVLSETMTMDALSGLYRDVSFDGIDVRAFIYNDSESPKNAYATLEPDGERFRRAFDGIDEPLLISPVGGLFLIGNMQDVKNIADAAKLFQTDPDVLPDVNSMEGEKAKSPDPSMEKEGTMGDENMETEEMVESSNR